LIPSEGKSADQSERPDRSFVAGDEKEQQNGSVVVGYQFGITGVLKLNTFLKKRRNSPAALPLLRPVSTT
jgi:hypothetical protein